MQSHGKRRGGFTDRSHQGTCTICLLSVYRNDEKSRGRGRYLGLVHTECLEKVEK
jgi:hypothetical protein